MTGFGRLRLLSAMALMFLLAVTLSTVAGAQQKTTITFWMAGGTDDSIPLVRRLITEFEAKNPNIAVRFQVIPWAEDPHMKYQTAAVGGTLADVFTMGSPFEHVLAGAGVLEPLDRYISNETRNDFFPQFIANSTCNGKLVALPWFGSVRALFYRRDLLAAEGIPEPTTSWTWEEFLSYAKRLTKDLNGDGIIDQYGFGTSGRYVSQYQPFVIQNGGNFVDEDRMLATANSPEVLEAMQFYVDLVRVHKVSPPGISTILLNEIQKMFAEGKVAMFFDCEDTAINFDKEPSLKGKFGIGLLPHRKQHAAFAGTDVIGLSSKSKNKDAAWKFIDFMVSPESMAQYCLVSGFSPARRSLADHPGFQTPLRQAFIKQLEIGGYFYFRTPKSSAISRIVRTETQEALEGKKTVQQAMNDAQKQLQEELGRP
ncbi:MAG: ABC transporter substrate-binding protein [Firmicutes bacterium]|jgi:multiple sugar transport system substrate-binding protein|nr:ABC transporter substrate-binding protein [Bacillota bacterium]